MTISKKQLLIVIANHSAGLAGPAVKQSPSREAVLEFLWCILRRGWLRIPLRRHRQPRHDDLFFYFVISTLNVLTRKDLYFV